MAHYLPPVVMSYFQPKPLDSYTAIVKDTTTAFEAADDHKQTHQQRALTADSTATRLLCGYTGLSSYLHHYRQYTEYVTTQTAGKPVTVHMTPEQRRQKRREKQQRKQERWLKNKAVKYRQQISDTALQPGWTPEPYKTLFVGRLSYAVTVDTLKYEMKYYGKVVNVVLPKPRVSERKQAQLTAAAQSHTTNGDNNTTTSDTPQSTHVVSKRQQRKLDRAKLKQQKLSEKVKLLKRTTKGQRQLKTMKSLQPAVAAKQPADRPHCGYAFVEFEHSADMTAAYKDLDGRSVQDRRVVVDVERGRTVKDWLPRRLGGGLGYTRNGAPEKCQYYPGRQHNARYKDDPRFVPIKPAQKLKQQQSERKDVRATDVRMVPGGGGGYAARSSGGYGDNRGYDDRSRGGGYGGGGGGSGEKRHRDYDGHDDRRYGKPRR